MKNNNKKKLIKNELIRICTNNVFLSKIFCFLFIIFCKNGYNASETRNAINYYCDNITKREFNKLYKEIIYCIFRYHIIAHEYFLYNFQQLNDIGRKTFLAGRSEVDFIEQNTTQEVISILRNKYETYKFFKPYYKREIIKISSEDDKEIFLQFLKKHKEIVVKPLEGSWGIGVKVVNSSDIEPNSFFEEIILNGESVVEEKVKQVKFFQDFNSSSLNTIRLFTVKKNDIVKPLFAIIRFGLKNNVTDNFSTGGCVASIDTETGIIKTPAYNKELQKNNSPGFIIHPETKKTIIGLQIPKWNELLELSDKLARCLPDASCIGWDFALSDAGWLIIEANSTPGIQGVQFAERIGIRKKFDDFFNDVK